MPAIKLKKVTAEYLAQKEKEGKKEKEKNEKKNLEDVADDEGKSKDEDEEEEAKSYNFLDVKLLYDKRKRTIPVPEQKLIEWLDDNLEKKEDVNVPLLSLYEYYTETCQLQGINVVDVPVFNKYMREKFGKAFGFKESSPYKGLLKERKIKEKKPHVQGETLALKIKDIIHDVITTAGNPKRGLRFNTLKMGINAKYPALRVDLYPKKLRSALERGIRYGHIELVKGVGLCGFYRLPGESTLEEDKEEKKDKKKKKKEGEEGEGEEGEKKEDEMAENGADTSETDDSKIEESGTKRKLEEGETEGEGEPLKKKKKKKKKSKKISERQIWGRGEAAKHSDPQKVDDAFPLAITYQSDPKEASGTRIRQYITKHYGECNQERLKKALESGIEKGLWEQTRGAGMGGTFHLLIDTFNPSRSDTMDDRIAQAIVACHEPKQASAGLIKKYVSEYHPKLNIDARPYLFKHALERAANKGTVRQLTGIGATGTFMLVNHFFPSPAILAGESEDEEEEVESSEDERSELYVPRPTKHGRGRSPHKPAPPSRSKADRSVPAKKATKQAAKSTTPAKGKSKAKQKPKSKSKSKKSPKSRAVVADSSDEESSDAEQEETYTPRPTKRGRGGPATPARKATPAKKTAPAKGEPPAKKGKVSVAKGKAVKPAKSSKTPAKSSRKRR